MASGTVNVRRDIDAEFYRYRYVFLPTSTLCIR
jgi:hypothetical protein